MLKRKRAAEVPEEEEERGVVKYPTTAYDLSTRETIARIFHAGLGLKWDSTDLMTLIATAGYTIPPRTLQRWDETISGGGELYVEEETRGRPQALSIDEQRVLTGWVLVCNYKNIPVHLPNTQRFIEDTFDLALDESNVQRYLTAFGFAHRKLRLRREGYTVYSESLANTYIDWLRARRRERLFQHRLRLLCSFDFTLTSHITVTQAGYARKGGYFFLKIVSLTPPSVHISFRQCSAQF